MTKIAIKISQGSAVTQNALGGLLILSLLATFIQCMPVKNYVNLLTYVKVMSGYEVGSFY